MGVGIGGQGGRGTDIIDRDLIVLFFGLFSVGSPYGRGLIVLFRSFLLFFGLFSIAPLEIFLPTPLHTD